MSLIIEDTVWRGLISGLYSKLDYNQQKRNPDGNKTEEMLLVLLCLAETVRKMSIDTGGRQTSHSRVLDLPSITAAAWWCKGLYCASDNLMDIFDAFILLQGSN